MTGPEHYRRSEDLLLQAVGNEDAGTYLAAAQVHAQLAQAAATMSLTFAQIGMHGLPHTPATKAWADTLVPGR